MNPTRMMNYKLGNAGNGPEGMGGGTLEMRYDDMISQHGIPHQVLTYRGGGIGMAKQAESTQIRSRRKRKLLCAPHMHTHVEKISSGQLASQVPFWHYLGFFAEKCCGFLMYVCNTGT